MPQWRIPRSLLARLLASYLVLMLLGLGGLIAWAGQQLQDAALQRAATDRALQAQLIAQALQEPLAEDEDRRVAGGRSLLTLVRVYGTETGSRVTLLDTRLRVIASSDERIGPGQLLSGPELTDLRDGSFQPPADVRLNEVEAGYWLYAATAVVDEHGRPLGVVQLAAPMAPVYAGVARTWLGLAVAGGTVLALTVLVSLLLARQLNRPVTSLTQVSEALAAGHLDRRVRPGGPDEIQRLGHAFNRMADRLQKMLAQQQAFVASAAHELRTPLTAARLRLEMLAEPEAVDPDRLRRYAADVDQELAYLQRMVDQLLTLATLDEGHGLPRQPLDLAPVLYDVADGLSPVARQAGLALHVEVPPHLPLVKASAEEMRIAVRNLLDNALKYTPREGHVTLEAHAADGHVAITVRDTGVGISAEDQAHIFDRFYQTDRSRSRRSRGAGLGLALVQAIATAHGGEVTVASAAGEGSQFTLMLPAEA